MSPWPVLCSTQYGATLACALQHAVRCHPGLGATLARALQDLTLACALQDRDENCGAWASGGEPLP